MQQPVSQQPAKSRNMINWILAGCVIPVLLVLCCVVAFALVYVLSPATLEPVLALVGLSAKAQAAAYVPAGAPFFMAVDLDLKQAVNAQRIWNMYEKNAQAQTSMSDFKKSFRDQTGCDFDADIMPWLGTDAATFLTDTANLSPSTAPAPRGTTPPPPNLVVAVSTRDAAKAQAALSKCAISQKPKSEETYKGTKITVYQSSGAAAVVGKYVLLATTTDAIHASIDVSRGDTKSLDKDAQYTKMLGQLRTNRTATMYVQFAPLIDVINRSATGVQPQTLAQIEAYQSMGASLAFEPNGARIDFVMTFDSAKLPECTRQMLLQMTSPNQSLKAVPADTSFYVSSSSIKSTWDCILTQLDTTSKKQMQDTISALNKQMGIDIDADVLSWMTGEYAIAMTSAKPLSTGLPGVGVLVMFEARDPSLVNSKMTKIAGALGKQGVTFKDQTVKGVTMKTTSLGAPNDPTAPVIGYGIIGNFLVFGGPLDALGNAVDASKNPLANDPSFLAVQKVLPVKNSGYFYTNVSAIDKLILDTLTGSARTDYINEGQPWLKPIKAIGYAGEAGKSDTSTGTIFIYVPDQ